MPQVFRRSGFRSDFERARWIARAVEVLAVLSDERRDRCEIRVAAQRVCAGSRICAIDFPLVGLELRAVLEDDGRHAKFPNVVQQAAEPDPPALDVRQLKKCREALSVVPDALAVGGKARIIIAEAGDEAIGGVACGIRDLVADRALPAVLARDLSDGTVYDFSRLVRTDR